MIKIICDICGKETDEYYDHNSEELDRLYIEGIYNNEKIGFFIDGFAEIEVEKDENEIICYECVKKIIKNIKNIEVTND